MRRQASVVPAALLVVSVALYPHVVAAEIYLPRTKIHFKCKFPDGSYTEYKEREKWYFYAAPLPHAQAYDALDSQMKYVDPGGRQYLHAGTSDSQCIGVGKRNGRLFFAGGFENAQGQFVHFTTRNQAPGVDAPDWQNFPKKIPVTPDQTPEVRSFMRNESLYAGYGPQVVPEGNDQGLLYEQPLTAFRHPSVPPDTVLYVYQSTSKDYGRTWSPPIFTKQARLFEIGRLLTEQSWSAKVEMLIKDRSVR